MQTNSDPTSLASLMVELVKSSPLVGIAAGVIIALYAIGKLDPEARQAPPVNDELVLEALRLVRESKPMSNADASSMDSLIIRIDKLASELEKVRVELEQPKSQPALQPVVDHPEPSPVAVVEPVVSSRPDRYPAGDIGAGAGGGGDNQPVERPVERPA